MNSLSWLIYALQVVDGLRGATIPIIIFGSIAGFFATGTTIFFTHTQEHSWSDFKGEERQKIRGLASKASRNIWIVVGIAAVLQTFTPSRQTMLLIAGSEVGERVMKSEAVQGVVNPGVDLLKTWMKTETERLMKEATR